MKPRITTIFDTLTDEQKKRLYQIADETQFALMKIGAFVAKAKPPVKQENIVQVKKINDVKIQSR